MYHNVGKKISGLASLLCVVGIIASILFGVVFALSYNTVSQPLQEEITLPNGEVYSFDPSTMEHTAPSPVPHIIGGILIALVGALVSWISSLTLYGFGYLITKTAENNAYIKKLAGE